MVRSMTGLLHEMDQPGCYIIVCSTLNSKKTRERIPPKFSTDVLIVKG